MQTLVQQTIAVIVDLQGHVAAVPEFVVPTAQDIVGSGRDPVGGCLFQREGRSKRLGLRPHARASRAYRPGASPYPAEIGPNQSGNPLGTRGVRPKPLLLRAC